MICCGYDTKYCICFIFSDGFLSLQSEIHSSIKSSKKNSRKSSKLESLAHSDLSDSELDFHRSPLKKRQPGGLASSTSRGQLKSTFDTFKIATSNKMHIGGLASDSPMPSRTPGLGSSYDSGHIDPVVPYLPDSEINSYTISRFVYIFLSILQAFICLLFPGILVDLLPTLLTSRTT